MCIANTKTPPESPSTTPTHKDEDDVKVDEIKEKEFSFTDGMVGVTNEERKVEWNNFNPRGFILWIDVACPLMVWKAGWATDSRYYFLAFIFWWIQMTGALACFHRYFAHRSYKSGRVWTACMGLIGCLSGQAGPLHWADHHRLHHKHCEKVEDVHSPVTNGGINGKFGKAGAFFWAQGGYLLVHGLPTDYHKRVADWARYPELVWIDWAADKIYFGLCLYLYKAHGFNCMAWVFCLPSFLSMNCVQLVNSAAHLVGDYKYRDPRQDACRARNIWWLTPLMLGANWHNNHHAFPHCARAGMEWYEIDPMYYTIKLWEFLGLVYDVREPDMDKLNALRVVVQPEDTTTDAVSKKAE